MNCFIWPAVADAVHVLQGHQYTSTSVSLHCSAPATEPAAFWLLAVGRQSGLSSSSSPALVFSMVPFWQVQSCRVQLDVYAFGIGVRLTGTIGGWLGGSCTDPPVSNTQGTAVVWAKLLGGSWDLWRPSLITKCRPSGGSLDRWLFAQMHVSAGQGTIAGCTWGCSSVSVRGAACMAAWPSPWRWCLTRASSSRLRLA